MTTIFALWRKNEAFDNNYKPNNKAIIQEKEQVLTSRLALKKPEKNSQTKSLAIQGKHPVSDHSMLPLGKNKYESL